MKETTKKILELSHMTCPEVAKLLGVSYSTVASIRNYYSVKYPRKYQGKCTDYKLLYKMIEEGKTYPEIGAVFGITAQTVSYHAAKIGHRRVRLLDDAEIIKAYKAGKPMKRIEADFGCTRDLIYRTLKRNDIPAQRTSRYA